MPGTRARRLCPQAVVIAPDFEMFGQVSSSVMENFRRVTPLVEVLSLDEAFLDVRGSTRRLGSPLEIAEQLRAIHDEQGITARWGGRLGVGGEAGQPPGEARRGGGGAERITSFLHPLDVGELWGVGEKTQAMLNRLGLMTVGDVAHTPLRTLGRVGEGWAATSTSWPGAPTGARSRRATSPPGGGRQDDGRPGDVRPRHRRPRGDPARAAPALDEGHPPDAGRGRGGRTVSITVRFADFTTITRSRTLPEATDVTQEIYRTATRLYDALGLQRARLRLVGVRAEAWSRARRSSGSWSWASASTAGPTRTGRSTGRPGGSGAAVRPASLLS